MDPQEFLTQRVSDLKNLLSGNASVENTATFVAPGGLAGKPALSTGLHMLRSVGKEDAAKMSLLGGDAPVRDIDYDAALRTPVREILPGAVHSIR